MPDAIQQTAPEQTKLAVTSFDAIPEIEIAHRKKTSDFSKPVLMTSLTLHSDQAQQLLEHSFARVNQTLYATTRMMRAQNKLKEAKTAENQLNGLFDGFSQVLNATILDMEKCLKAKSSNDTITLAVYDHKRSLDVAIRTVYTHRLINLFQRLDYLIALADTMELQAVCSPDECDNTTKSWCRHFRKMLKAVNATRTPRSDAIG